MALFVALLLGLLSYHSRGRGRANWGIGLLILATGLALLGRSFSQPGASTAVVVLLVALALMLTLMTFHSQRWAHAVWWIGVLLFLLALPLLGAGRGELALFALIAGPGLLMLVATLYPQVPAWYARFGAADEASPPTAEELATERSRYTRLAGAITLCSLAGVWLLGGVLQGPVAETVGPVVFDEVAAERGAQLFTQYGCATCHSVTGQHGVGPTLRNAYNHRVRLEDGTELLRDDAYIRESILQPDAKTVNGYSRGVMLGAITGNLPEISQTNNLTALVEYIKSLAR